MKLWKVALCLLLVLCLVGCGDTPATEPEESNDKSATGGELTGGQEEVSAPQDTWFNAEGQYGTVEYTYDEHGNPEKTVFYHYSGKVWRTIEYDTIQDNAYSSLLHTQEIRNVNGSLLFSLSYTVQTMENSDRKIPVFMSSYDHFHGEGVCRIDYNSYGGEDSLNRYNTYRGAQDYAIITWKNSKQIEKITLFNREGSQKGTHLFYYEDGKVEYIGACNAYRDSTYEFYKVEYDNGRISHLIYGRANLDQNTGKVIGFSTSSYGQEILIQRDDDGHIVQIEEKDNSFRYIRNYSFEGDALIASEYLFGRTEWDLEYFDKGYFTFNADGTFATADYGFLDGSLGGGDTSYYVFTYYDNGMISNVKGYFKSPVNAGSDELDLEWEYNFNADGTLISD